MRTDIKPWFLWHGDGACLPANAFSSAAAKNGASVAKAKGVTLWSVRCSDVL